MDRLKAIERGDDVRYNWQGSTVRGRVVEVVTEGTARDSSGETTMDASEDNPVYRVRLVDDEGEDTDTVVLRRGDSLTVENTAGDKPDKSAKMHGLLEQAEVGYTPDYTGEDGRCASCRWFKPGHDGHDKCHIVKPMPAPILATGRCERHELPPTDEPDTLPEADVMIDVDAAGYDEDEKASEPNLLQKGWDAVRSLFPRGQPMTDGFKTAGNTWLAVWSNNFEDKDGEWFSWKAMDDYVYRVDHGLVPLPDLWVWHIGENVKIGSADWVGRHGHFMLAAGTFDETEQGQKAREFYARNAQDTRISHGFAYDTEQFVDGVYHQFNTFEISLLPRGVEANRYTSLEGVKQMALDDKKRSYLEKVFGKETAEEILADYDKAGKALEEIGVQFKEFHADPRTETPETEAVKEATQRADENFSTLFVDLIGDHAEVLEQNAAMATEINTLRGELKAANEAATKAVEAVDALRQEMQLRPRAASQADETVLDEDSQQAKNIQEEIKRQTTRKHEFWGTTVSDLSEES